MSRIRKMVVTNKLFLMKTFSYYVMHIFIAVIVAYAITGNWAASVALSLIEPSIQAIAFFFHEKAWAKKLTSKAIDTQIVAP